VSGLIRTAECSDNDAPTPGEHNSPRSTMRFATVVSLPMIGRGTRAGDRRAGDISGSCPGPCCGCRLGSGFGSGFGAGVFPAPSDAGQRQCDASREACRGQRPVSGRRRQSGMRGGRRGGAGERAARRLVLAAACAPPRWRRHGIPRLRLSVAQIRCHRERSDYSLLTTSYFKLSEAQRARHDDAAERIQNLSSFPCRAARHETPNSGRSDAVDSGFQSVQRRPRSSLASAL
jgi:hypothetical protein